MSRRKRTLNVSVERTSPRRGHARALAAVLTLAAAGIGATAWLTNAQEPTRVTTTAATAAPSNTASQQAQPSTTMSTATAANANAASTQPALQQPTAQQPAAPQPAAPSAAGQRAFIDPVTGQLRQPEHDELAAIAAAAAAAPARRLSRTAATTAPETFGPDGSVEAVVPEDLHTFTVATRGPDGRITIEHAQGAKNAVKVMKANSAKKGPHAPVSRETAKEDRNDR
jgi:hypothetical protein